MGVLTIPRAQDKNRRRRDASRRSQTPSPLAYFSKAPFVNVSSTHLPANYHARRVLPVRRGRPVTNAADGDTLPSTAIHLEI